MKNKTIKYKNEIKASHNSTSAESLTLAPKENLSLFQCLASRMDICAFADFQK